MLLPKGLKEHVNPADYLSKSHLFLELFWDSVDISSVDTRTPDAERESQTRVSRLVSAWQTQSYQFLSNHPIDYPQTSLASSVTRPAKVEHHAPLLRQVRVLTSRMIVTTYRDPMGLMASWAEAILMGLVSGLVFLHLSKTASGIRDREGALYIGASLQGEAYKQSFLRTAADGLFVCTEYSLPVPPLRDIPPHWC